MNIGIIGAGSVGSSIGRAVAQAGHPVRFGVRDSQRYAQLPEACGGDTQLATPAQAAVWAEILILAVPFVAVPSAVTGLGALTGKILVDATNRIGFDAAGPTVLPMSGFASGAEALQMLLPAARVVKAFNTFGAETSLDPMIEGQALDLHLAGDDPQAKAQVAVLAGDLGFRPVDCGPLRNAALLEHMAALWVHLAVKGGYGRKIGFRLLGG